MRHRSIQANARRSWIIINVCNLIMQTSNALSMMSWLFVATENKHNLKQALLYALFEETSQYSISTPFSVVCLSSTHTKLLLLQVLALYSPLHFCLSFVCDLRKMKNSRAAVTENRFQREPGREGSRSHGHRLSYQQYGCAAERRV